MSWFMWATLLYFVPFRYVALFVGEITLISLSRPGQLLLQTVFSLFDARTGGQEFASSIGSSQTAVKKDE